MRKLILASHGGLASGMLDSVEMITGKLDVEVEIYSLQPGMLASDYAKQLQAEIENHKEKEFVIVTDLYGASVASGLAPLSTYDNVVVFTGMCSSLVLNLVCSYKEKLTEESVKQLVLDSRAGCQAIQLCQIDQTMEEF